MHHASPYFLKNIIHYYLSIHKINFNLFTGFKINKTINWSEFYKGCLDNSLFSNIMNFKKK